MAEATATRPTSQAECDTAISLGLKESNRATSQLTTLRLYFDRGMRLQGDRWHSRTAPQLAEYLPRLAQAFGIQQVVLHQVQTEFLQDEQGDRPGASARELLQYLEMIDQEATLREFVQLHRAALQPVRIVLLREELHLHEDLTSATICPPMLPDRRPER